MPVASPHFLNRFSKAWRASLGRWAAGVTFPSPPSLAWSRRCNHCAGPCAGCVPESAGCTQNGSKDRSRCTACRSATRSRTWGTGRRDRQATAKANRIANSGRRRACPASGSAADQRCLLDRPLAGLFLPGFLAAILVAVLPVLQGAPSLAGAGTLSRFTGATTSGEANCNSPHGCYDLIVCNWLHGGLNHGRR